MKDHRGVTHHQFDFDGGSCLRMLEKLGMIQDCIFGEKALEEVLGQNKVKKLIFVDASPKESIQDVEVVVYDHHPTNSEGENQASNKTAFDILLDSIETAEFDRLRIDKWRKLVMLGDKKSENDDMDITRALKRVHSLLDSDVEVYRKWFVPLFDSFFVNEPDLDRAIKLLQTNISRFVSGNPQSHARVFLQRWSERLRDKEKISKSTLRNVVHFLAYMDENTGREWVDILLDGYNHEQEEFQECKADFHRASVSFYGNTLIISAITKSSRFVQVARHMILSKDQDINPLIKEKIKDRNSPWLVALVNPRNKNFQIFVNGNKVLVYEIIVELIKAIRAETLLKRGYTIPKSEALCGGGGLEGTEPLYFHKLETGYPSILWGSQKHPVGPATEFGSTSAEIHSRLVGIVKLALDENEYVADCDPARCDCCSIFSWQLKKCLDRSRQFQRKR